MESRFRHAFLWHLDHEPSALAAISRETGVSVDILKKLKSRENYSPHAEAALAISSYFGKSLDSFMRCEPAGTEAEFVRIAASLSPEDRRLLLVQMRAIQEDRRRLEEIGHTLARAPAHPDEES